MKKNRVRLQEMQGLGVEVEIRRSILEREKVC